MNSTTPRSVAELMNNDLQRLYELYLPKIHLLIEKCGWPENEVSQLFTMRVDESYIQAPCKILFVGRETFGWYSYGVEKTAAELMNDYGAFSQSGKHFHSPFWWFRRDLSQKFGINEADFMKATLWTNVSKIDVRKTKPINTEQQFDELVQVFIQLLVAEVGIVNPDVVVIMSRDGFYNWHLENYNWQENKTYFDSDPLPIKLEKRRLDGVRIEQLIGGDLLPAHTYQMCHPRALLSKGGNKANLFIEAIYRSVTATSDQV